MSKKQFQQPLMYDAKERSYYFLGNPECDGCNKRLEEFFMLCVHFSKKEWEIYYYCINCFQKYDVKREVSEYKIVTPVNKRPRNALPVVMSPPQLKDLSSVFEAAYNTSDKVEDKTVFAGRTELSKLDYNDKSPVIKGVLSEEDKIMNSMPLNFIGMHRVQKKLEDRKVEK